MKVTNVILGGVEKKVLLCTGLGLIFLDVRCCVLLRYWLPPETR